MSEKKHVGYNKRFILAGITLVVVGGIFYLTFQITRPFLGILTTSGIFAIFLNPFYQRLQSLKLKNEVSALLTILALFIFLIVPLGLLTSSLFSEAVRVTRSMQTNPDLINSLQKSIEQQLQSLQVPVEIEDLDLKEQIYQSLSFLTKSLSAALFFTGGMLFNLFFVLITMYFLLTNQKMIADYINDLDLFPKNYLRLISSRTTEIVNGTIRGYLVVVILQLVVGIVGFMIFEIPTALLLGSLYGVSSLLPLVGGFLVWIPVVVWQLSLGNTLTAFLLTTWFLVLSFIIENIVAPRIIGESTKLHQLFIMFSVFGGIQFFGLLGMVLGPVIIALAFVALTILNDFANTTIVDGHETK